MIRNGSRSPYRFRKTDDGRWQRRHDNGDRWETLEVTHRSRMICTGAKRNGDKRYVEKTDTVWIWV